MLKKNLKALSMLIAVFLISTPVFAKNSTSDKAVSIIPLQENCNEYREILKKCGEAVRQLQKEIGVKQELIKSQDELLLNQQEQIHELNSEINAWYNNKYLIIGVGIIGGAFLHKELTE